MSHGSARRDEVRHHRPATLPPNRTATDDEPPELHHAPGDGPP